MVTTLILVWCEESPAVPDSEAPTTASADISSEPTLAGASPSHPQTAEPFPGHDAATGEGRTRPPTVEAVVEGVDLYHGIGHEWGYPIPGREYVANWDTVDSRKITIARLEDGEVVFDYRVSDDTRYVGTAVFIGHSAYINIVPDLFKVDFAEATELLHVDLLTGSATTVEPPDGSIWNQWPMKLRAVDGRATWMSNRDDNWTQCVVAVEGGTSVAHEVRCFEGERFAFSTASTGGVSILGFPADEDIQSCRVRYLVPLDGGEPRLIGDDDSCRPYDGLSVDGWDVWIQIPETTDSAEYLHEGALWANVPSGERLQLGPSVNGSLTPCDHHVYWRYHRVSREYGSFDAIYRWQPGAPEIELAYRTPDEYYAHEITCSEGRVGVHMTTVEVDIPQDYSVYLLLGEQG